MWSFGLLTQGSQVWSTTSSITWQHMHAVTSLVHWLSLRNFWSRDKFSSNTQVWSIFKLFEYASLVHFEQKKWTKPANSNWFDATLSQTIRIRRFDPFFCSNWTKLAYSKSLNMDLTCVFDENLSRDQKFRRESQWTKLMTACICCHVMKEVVDQTWDPRVSWILSSFSPWSRNHQLRSIIVRMLNSFITQYSTMKRYCLNILSDMRWLFWVFIE